MCVIQVAKGIVTKENSQGHPSGRVRSQARMGEEDAQKRPAHNTKNSPEDERVPGGFSILWCKFLR